jgi:hypothetical protein
MIRDPLYSAIEEGLSKPIDADAFERCAASLLRQLYPTLVPVPGGGDAGMDGYAADPDARPIVLVTTTAQNVARNLRKNLESHVKSGGRARRALLATSHLLSGRRRVSLQQRASELGFDLIQIFDRAWFVDELYRVTRWRKELLEIPGEQPALSVTPPSRRPTLSLSLVGRDGELHALRSVTGDVVVVGKPGMGKTAVLRQLALEGWGLFVVDDSNERLPDAIREQRPSRIIVDDAHFDPPRLTKLRQMREEIAGDFGIVAVTWPGEQADVEAHLASARSIEIGPLTRDEIVRVIEEAGLKGPSQFQREVVDQARGRPGLAATLALLALNGKAREVATGEALLQDTRVTYREILGAQSAAVLAVIALSGEFGVEMSTVGTALGLDLASTQALVQGLASGGTIDEAEGGRSGLIVQPESLRYAVVREMFFGGAAPLPLGTALEAFPDRAVAIVPLVGAGHRGADLDQKLMQSLLREARYARAFAAYASLGEKEAKFALSVEPEHALDIAQAALLHTPSLGFRILMEQAVGDDRPRHSYPGHPMRILKDYLGAPSGMLEQRQQLLGIVSDWVAGAGDPDIGLEALCCALGPRFETVTTDPGQGNKVTIRRGILALQGLRQIASLWEQALGLIPAISCQSYASLLDVLWDWAFPGRLALGASYDEKSYHFMRKQAARLVKRLATALSQHRGVLARLATLAEQAELGVEVNTDREFDVLFPERDLRRHGSDWRAAEQSQADAAQRLAESMQTLVPEEVASRIAAAETEAAQAGITWPRFTPNVCAYLAEHAAKPHEFANAFRDAAVPEDLLVPFLSAVARERPKGWAELLSEFLRHDRYWRSAVAVCLAQPVGESLQTQAICQCDGSFVNYLRVLIARDELDVGAQDGLLEHSNHEVARTVAIELRTGGRELPPETQEKWEAAIIRCPADDHWYATILKSRHSLLVNWVEAWLERQASAEPTYEHIPKALLGVIADLPVESKAHLLDCIPAKPYNPYVADLVARLVGNDDRLAAALFGRAELRQYHKAALIGRPTSSWLKRAIVALNHGWSPERTIAACTSGLSVWSGSEAAHWEGWVKDFEKLGRSRGRQAKLLSQAGVEHYGRLRDVAVERERHEAVYGLS